MTYLFKSTILLRTQAEAYLSLSFLLDRCLVPSYRAVRLEADEQIFNWTYQRMHGTATSGSWSRAPGPTPLTPPHTVQGNEKKTVARRDLLGWPVPNCSSAHYTEDIRGRMLQGLLLPYGGKIQLESDLKAERDKCFRMSIPCSAEIANLDWLGHLSLVWNGPGHRDGSSKPSHKPTFGQEEQDKAAGARAGANPVLFGDRICSHLAACSVNQPRHHRRQCARVGAQGQLREGVGAQTPVFAGRGGRTVRRPTTHRFFSQGRQQQATEGDGCQSAVLHEAAMLIKPLGPRRVDTGQPSEGGPCQSSEPAHDGRGKAASAVSRPDGRGKAASAVSRPSGMAQAMCVTIVSTTRTHMPTLWLPTTPSSHLFPSPHGAPTSTRGVLTRNCRERFFVPDDRDKRLDDNALFLEAACRIDECRHSDVTWLTIHSGLGIRYSRRLRVFKVHVTDRWGRTHHSKRIYPVEPPTQRKLDHAITKAVKECNGLAQLVE
ncbi:unnamed protein product [Vitrella brassicaformis CCMP3155]|uniref:Uncharacterized protein n=1 Tax=Vitrella brassicaformis (strain CCMP3155) TaxID=1169540 RepID=A0A0G4EZN0_VITBC|nr:unnamed protein product [Vitrella brassicaformis CCMP3155]|eukprot:CEM04469.1 unnamed protein product [Vitrella brassicaformis CCMP3155]